MAGRKGSPLWKRSLKATGYLVLTFVSAVALLYLAVLLGLFGTLPTERDLAALRTEEATLVYSTEGAVIGKVFARDRTNIRHEDLPPHLINALVATEDQRFFEHQGVDAWSYLRVLFRTVIAGDPGGGGGSTISQQIIKNLYGRERHGVLTVPVNKIKEIICAQRLEEVYSKDEVITLYFNSVPFGENLYGVEVAAQRFFRSSTRELVPEESAVLVGMLKANTRYNPRLHPEDARRRRDQVLQLMRMNSYLTKPEADSLCRLPLELHYQEITAHDAQGYFVAEVASQARALLAGFSNAGRPYDIEKDGLRIHTTLDTAVQAQALASVRSQLTAMQPDLDRELRQRKERRRWEKQVAASHGRAWKINGRKVREVFRWKDVPADTMSYRDSLWHYHRMLHAAVLVMEPVSGRVRAWVGGNDHRLLPYDLVRSRRHIASTIKPALYAAGLAGGLQPCDYLQNEEKTYAEREDWHPRNFDGSSGGEVALWHALVHSMNLPTVDLYFRTDTATIRRTFRKLGLPEVDVDKPSLALGATDVSLLQIVRAYGIFANGGRTVSPVMIDRITDAEGRTIYEAGRTTARTAIDPMIAADITAMLRRAVDEGTGASLRSRFGLTCEIAGKTGTAQNYSDAWFVAYTPGLVIGTWVGSRDPGIHFTSNRGTGAQLALPIAGKVLRSIERSRELRKHYLIPFEQEAVADMDCAGTRGAVSLDRFLDELFPSRTDPQRTRSDTTAKEKKKGFWKKLFPSRPR